MTLEVADHQVLRAALVALKMLLGRAAGTDGQTKHDSRSPTAFREMTSAGDLLLGALRIEEEFSKTDLTHADETVLERWRSSRRNVEQMAIDYAEAVTNWRTSLEQGCKMPGNESCEPDESPRSTRETAVASSNIFAVFSRVRRLPYDLLIRVNRQLVIEKVELLEEVRQLKAAVHIYRELAAKRQSDKVA